MDQLAVTNEDFEFTLRQGATGCSFFDELDLIAKAQGESSGGDDGGTADRNVKQVLTFKETRYD